MATQNSNLQVTVTAKDELTPDLQRIESKVIRAVGAISASLAALKIGSAPILAAAEFERELANVQKTTNFLESDMRRLGDAILQMSQKVNVGAVDLAKIAAAAGQQGLGRFGVEGVVQFTDSVARMSSVLDITAEDAANNIGKIANVFKIPLRDIERAVSTFNEVSNNSTASGKELLDVVKRIGDAAGSLDLQQATALAATGLDFGQSPEVVGTAYAKVFSSMFQKADKFAELIGKPTDEFLKFLQEDGFAAYRAFLTAVRKLDAQSQQTAITKLIGGGRLGALINKQVQDTSDSVLLSNLASAKRGQGGLSAIREQATVLNTLTAQAQILQNSFFKLGAEGAQQLLEPLKQYAAQLSIALQSDGARSFVKSVLAGIGETIEQVVALTKFIGSLNINWENFVKVGALFLKLKLAETIIGLVPGFRGIGAGLQSIATQATAATAATTQLGAATSAAGTAAQASSLASLRSLVATKFGLQQLIDQYKVYKKSQEDAANSALNAASKENEARRKQREFAQANRAAQAANSDAVFASSDSGAASARLRRAREAGAAAELADRTALANRLAAAETQNQQRLADIQTAFEARKAAIRATGSRAGLAAAQRENAEQIATQEASHQRSIRSIESYWARRIAATVAGANAAVAAEAVVLARANAALDTTLAARSAANTNASDRKAAADAARAAADTAKDAANRTSRSFSEISKNLFSFTGIAAAAGVAFGAVGTALKTLGAVAVRVGGLIAGSFFWVTIIYSIADAIGVLDRVGPALQRITDYLGITSAARRDAAVAAEKEKEANEAATRALNDQTEAYQKNVDVRTGRTDQSFIAGNIALASQSEDSGRRREAANVVVEALNTQRAVSEGLSREATAANQKLIDEQAKIIADGQAQIAQITKLAARDAVRFPINTDAGRQLANEYANQLRTAQSAVDSAKSRVEALSRELKNGGVVAESAAKAYQETGAALAAMFTPQSLDLVRSSVLPFVEAGEQARRIQDTYTTAQKQAIASGDLQSESLRNLAASLVAANERTEELRKAMNAAAIAQLQQPGISPEVRKSLEDFAFYASLSSGSLESVLGALQAINKAQLTGAKAGVVGNTAATGTRAFSTKSTESAADKEKALRAARLQLERAELDALNKLRDEQAKQEEARSKEAYDRGLKTIEEYYADRRRIQLQGIEDDKRSSILELAAVQREIEEAQKQQRALEGKANAKKRKAGAATPSDTAEIIRLRADAVRISGEIAVLERQKDGINEQIDRDREAALTAFQDRVRSEGTKLLNEGLIAADATTVFKANLDDALAQYRDFLAALRNSGRVDFVNLAGAIENSLRLQAYTASLQPLQQTLTNLTGGVERYKQKLDLLQLNGAITAQENEAAYSAAIKSQIPLLEKQLRLQQAHLEMQLGSGKVSEQVYAAQAAAIDETRIRLAQLMSQVDQTAKAINSSITDSLADALHSLEADFSNLGDVARSFLRSVFSTINQALTRDLAEQFMRAIGSSGAGGIGEFVQGIIQGGRGGTPADASSKVTDRFLQRGQTVGTPLYVMNVDGSASGLLGKAISQDPITNLDEISKTIAEASGPQGVLNGPAADSFFGRFTGIFSGGISGLVQGLGGALTGLVNSLGSTLSGIFGGGSGGGGIFSFVSSLFHNGGIVGANSGMSRRVPIGIFKQATRYHTGGIAGLAPNEVPAIMKKGEEVLTQSDPRHRDNLQSSANAQVPRIVNVLDPDLARDFMESSAGEQVILNHIRRNASSISQTLRK